MNGFTKITGVLLGLALSSQALWAGSITYKNHRGSVLELQFSDKNQLNGFFTTAVASKECSDVIGTKIPVIGYVDSTAITISMNYPSCGSIVTLTGHVSANKDKINAIALIAHQQSLFAQGAGTETITNEVFSRESNWQKAG